LNPLFINLATLAFSREDRGRSQFDSRPYPSSPGFLVHPVPLSCGVVKRNRTKTNRNFKINRLLNLYKDDTIGRLLTTDNVKSSPNNCTQTLN